ncbi:hypothetical protein K4F87_19185 (plasmid) [Phaeobacter inhibens]|nr:hypothetical protein K4F87_19185 [Phaeobacter inhibens]
MTLENGFFARSARQGRSVGERKEMTNRDHKLSLTRQADLLGIMLHDANRASIKLRRDM